MRALNGTVRRFQKMDGKRIDPPNQALQTTQMARIVYEKTIEFGHPQRGV